MRPVGRRAEGALKPRAAEAAKSIFVGEDECAIKLVAEIRQKKRACEEIKDNSEL